MDNRINELNKEQRIALARIISDIIISDKIIDEEEVRIFSNLFGQNNNRDLFHKAQSLTFAQSIKMLCQPLDNSRDSTAIKNLNQASRKKNADITTQIISETAISDGFCAPPEAILLLSVDYFLNKNNSSYTKYDVQSFKLTDVFIGKRFVLYADFSNSVTSYTIEKHYELIVNLLAGIGFQFIYIPKIVEQYKEKGLEKFKELSMYIFPDIADDKVEETYNKILDMTTKKFIRECCNQKLGFNMECPEPSLMVMLGRSSRIGKDINDIGLVYETYANFLKIKLGKDDVLETISNFVFDFNNIVSFNVNIDFNPAKNKLLYHGIYKAFFRLVALVKENSMRYTIDINTALNSIFINDNKLDLPLGIAAIYVLILYRSIFGDKKGLPMKTIYDTLSLCEKEKLQQQYEMTYCYMKNIEGKHLAKLYPNVTNRISVIRNALDRAVDKKFIGEIQLGVGDYVRTIVTPDHVTINGTPINLHPLWFKLSN